ncbi:peptide/nickel transport system permease protein [Thermocatellispora tengchongensis]|uniref:Peptide/nickel transport system permease protein n=1 Tax=Thermocatellispora tengchongensis TaxID=1073253 RepID=A0A840PAZ7_9ACTN|nr:ABC transporter permease [Thermocatellispora tengchongensis]MBB5134367.1 peptide/nickel transport system permease protein [Thermocatellispora tengchongensis]
MRLALWWSGRALSAAATLLGVSVLIFAAVRMMPGGFAETILGPFATPEQKAELAARYGLDQPVFLQYGHWLAAVAGGDFGTSMISRQPVADELLARLPVTAELTAFSVAAALLLGVPLGVLTAVRARPRGGAAAGRLLSGLGVSVPEFVLGSLAVFLFSRYALGVPAGGYVPFGQDPAGNLASMVLPSAVLSVFALSATARTTRDAVLGVLVEPYVTAAVARGETPWFIVRHHILRNAAGPVVTLVATITAYLLGGALVVEYVFNLPGIGSYIVQAVGRRDYAVVQAGVLLAAAVFIVMNALVDLAVGALDPRLGVTGKGAA